MKLFNWLKKPKTTKPDPNTKYYKVLGKNQTSCWGGEHTWKPNEWTPRIKNIKPYEKWWHLCRLEDLPRWLNEEIWEVEIAEDAEIIEEDDKVVTIGPIRITKQLNWNKQVAIMFAADCAEHVFHVFEDAYPTDDRPRKAIEAAREYAKDMMSEENKEKADAAAIAARAAAAYAAYAVTYGATYAADAAGAAAADAARAAYTAAYAYAADAASRAAARADDAAAAYADVADTADAALAAERKWQAERLRKYLEETK